MSSSASSLTFSSSESWEAVSLPPAAPSLQYHYEPFRYRYRAPTSSQDEECIERTVMQLQSRSNAAGVQEYRLLPVKKAHVIRFPIHSTTGLSVSGRNILQDTVHRYRLTSSFLNSPSKALDHARVGYALQTKNIPILVSPADALLRPKHTQIAFATRDIVMVYIDLFEASKWSRDNNLVSILATTGGGAPLFSSPHHLGDTLTERVQKLNADRMRVADRLAKDRVQLGQSIPTREWTLVSQTLHLATLMLETRRFMVDPRFHSTSSRPVPQPPGECDVLFVVPVLPRTAAQVQLLLLVIALLEPTYYTATSASRGEPPCIDLSDALANVHGVLRRVLPPHGTSVSCQTILSSEVILALELQLRAMIDHSHRTWSLCKSVNQVTHLPAFVDPTCHSCLPESYIAAHTWHWPPVEEQETSSHMESLRHSVSSAAPVIASAAAAATPPPAPAAATHAAPAPASSKSVPLEQDLVIDESQPMEEDSDGLDVPISHTHTTASQLQLLGSSGSPALVQLSPLSSSQDVFSQSSDFHVSRTWSTNPVAPSQTDSAAFSSEARRFASHAIRPSYSSPQRPVRSPAIVVASAEQCNYQPPAMDDAECTASELAPTLILSPFPA